MQQILDKDMNVIAILKMSDEILYSLSDEDNDRLWAYVESIGGEVIAPAQLAR